MKTSKLAVAIALAVSIGVGSISTAHAETPAREPDRGPGDIRQPWQPPTGPGDLRDTPENWQPPEGPGGLTDVDRPRDVADRVNPIGKGCIGGKMIDKQIDDSYLESYGWQVRLFIYKSNPGGELLSSPRIALDHHGEWSYCLPPIGPSYANKKVLFTYEATNANLRIEDERYGDLGRPWWFGPHGIHADPPQGGIYQEYAQMPSSLNSAGKNYGAFKLNLGPQFVPNPHYGEPGEPVSIPSEWWGVNHIMRWGMQLIDKLGANDFKQNRTINNSPRAHVIRFSPGNSCGACYNSTDKDVKLDNAPEHLDRWTVQHELGHSVTDEYWKGLGSAVGAHDVRACTTNMELAWTEGIADFIAVWAHNDDMYDLDSVNDDQFSAETPNVRDECPDWADGGGAWSEQYVATALWDMHDHVNEGNGDEYGLKKMRSTLNLVLTHKFPTAPQFNSWYANTYPDWAFWSTKVFANNEIPTLEELQG